MNELHFFTAISLLRGSATLRLGTRPVCDLFWHALGIHFLFPRRDGTSRPVSRILFLATSRWRFGDHPSASAVASTLMRSTSGLRAGHSSTKAGGPAHLTLLPVGFAEPRQSPAALVVSYTALSPLPRSLEAVCSLWHCPAGHPGWALPTTVPCGVRTFLDACAPRSPGRLVRRSGYAAPTIDPVSVLPST